MVLYSRHNTTCGWIWSLFSDVYKNISACKKICLYSVTRIKLPQDSTIGCTSGFGCVWAMLIKLWKSRLDSSIGCILVKFRIVRLCLQDNTTYGWTWSLFSAAYEDMSGRKNICPYSATRTKLTHDSTIGWTLLWFTILWTIALKLEKIHT